MADKKYKAKKKLIEVFGAKENNLKNIDVSFPRNKLVVFTGLSGSGKSSLAFETIYAEGQRRYIESFSSYARQFLGGLDRPDVDKITGLSPVISIEQKTTNKNPRSTVGTVTEIYDFLRLLFARAGIAYSYNSGAKMVHYTDEQICETIQKQFKDQTATLLAPVVRSRKGHYRELFEKIRKKGYLKARIDGQIHSIGQGLQLDRYKIHDVEVVIDTFSITNSNKKRLKRSVADSMKMGKDSMMLLTEKKELPRYFSRNLMCPDSGIAYDDPAPNLFSFNSPYGACSKCSGLGEVLEIDIKKIVPNSNSSIKKGGIVPLGTYRDNWIFRQIEAIAKVHNFTLDTPINKLPDGVLDILLYGSNELIALKNSFGSMYNINFEGIANFINNQVNEYASRNMQKWAHSFMCKIVCPKCKGTRLKKEAQYFKIADKNIAELGALSIDSLYNFFDGIEVELTSRQNQIANEVIKELKKRIQFLLDVGLDYLTLNRPTRSLSGGEAQRIRLATQIGAELVGVLYILDEPSIGLHQRDNARLINALKKLRNAGNSIIVIEHDKDMMLAADYIIDFGPGAGLHGGTIIAQGKPDDFLQSNTTTAAYLNNEKTMPSVTKKTTGNGNKLTLKGATGHNLKNVNISLPLGKFICVTGVSGSGKSSLINETLFAALNNKLHRSQQMPLPYKAITGDKHIDKIISIDQMPIGRTPRSNPATYTGVFTDIRQLFSQLPEAKIRGYAPGRFSFNVKGGRCETCRGAGKKIIEMNFLPDVEVLCETCQGNRYNRETLEVRYKGKSIFDILEMPIEDAVVFFDKIPSIIRKINVLNEIGLGYLTLGQSSTSLSGGEAQRVKLSAELNRPGTGNTLYLLDEPTTGLHFEDIRVLLIAIRKLVDTGNTVLVIEHNMDIIKSADHIIDLGPEGGEKGGHILFEGTPKAMLKIKDNFTAYYLSKEIETIKKNTLLEPV